MERLYLLETIERGMSQADSGQTVPNNEARRRMERWLKYFGPSKRASIPGLVDRETG